MRKESSDDDRASLPEHDARNVARVAPVESNSTIRTSDDDCDGSLRGTPEATRASTGKGHMTRYRILLDAVPDAVTVHDEAGNIVDANAAAVRTYGYPLPTLRGMNVRDLNPNLPPDHMQAVVHSHEAEHTFSVISANLRADGSRFPVEVHSNVFLDDGQPRILAVARDISERVQAERELRIAAQRLRHQARIDTLTGLPNRGTILGEIEHAIEHAPENAGPAVLYIDMDRFKVLNDMLGHAAGDRLLRASAERLRVCCDGIAECGRYDNDEFVVLLPRDDDRTQARKLARQIIQAFDTPFDLDGDAFVLTTSIGMAHYPEHGDTPEQLIRHADAAMYEAKHRGRHTMRSYDQVLATHSDARRQIESQLRLALDQGELRLAFQPKISLREQRIIGAEALLRWHSSQFGEVSPVDFIPHAENSGEIVRIGAWVVHEACRQLRAWRDQGLELGHVAVNVSFRQLLSGTFCECVRTALRTHNLPGEALELEMTERILIDEAPDTLETFKTLKQMGVTLTIDDFGEGYSSFNYLRRLPIDSVKISHTFMQGIPTQPADTAICEAIVRIADSLHLNVVAEGVETEAQKQFLQRIGTADAQGFLFSHPLPAGQIPEFIRQWPALVPTDTATNSAGKP
jgi:diguanylate cyclase (GGDEF)-like protein/PAS domain S-box-containing protein